MFPSTIRGPTWTSSCSFCPNVVPFVEGFDSLQKVNEERSSGAPKIAICRETVGGWREYNSAFRCYFCAMTSAPLRTHRNNVCPSCFVMNWLPPGLCELASYLQQERNPSLKGSYWDATEIYFYLSEGVNGTVIIWLMEKLPCEDEWSALETLLIWNALLQKVN